MAGTGPRRILHHIMQMALQVLADANTDSKQVAMAPPHEMVPDREKACQLSLLRRRLLVRRSGRQQRLQENLRNPARQRIARWRRLLPQGKARVDRVMRNVLIPPTHKKDIPLVEMAEMQKLCNAIS
mmetsp:Transcript_63577/g.100537  ORF Transcript_63577/g.100537 Transcript_63577/m.100537 type:complete len:127 (+) Transcript_63577:1005-1385(+)